MKGEGRGDVIEFDRYRRYWESRKEKTIDICKQICKCHTKAYSAKYQSVLSMSGYMYCMHVSIRTYMYMYTKRGKERERAIVFLASQLILHSILIFSNFLYRHLIFDVFTVEVDLTGLRTVRSKTSTCQMSALLQDNGLCCVGS